MQRDVQIDIAVRQRFAGTDLAERDALMALVEEIGSHFEMKRTQSGFAWRRTENRLIFVPEHIGEFQQFTSVITLTFMSVRGT